MIKEKDILIDSCIINYGSSSKKKDLAIKTSEILTDLITRKNSLWISEFSVYEILRGANETKKYKAQEYLKLFKNIENSKERLDRATKLYSAYSKNPKVREILHSISDIDIFIGSLIFTDQQPLLLTCDYDDFPRPFFTEKDCLRVEYKNNKNRKECLYYYFLQANLESIL